MLAWFGLFAPVITAATTPLTTEEVQDLAVDAYIYAYPLVIMEITRQVSTNVGAATSTGRMNAPMNQFGHATVFPDDRFEAVVRANAATGLGSLGAGAVRRQQRTIDR